MDSQQSLPASSRSLWLSSRNAVALLGCLAGLAFFPRTSTAQSQICRKWAHATALGETTLFVFGGNERATVQQTSETYISKLYSLDLARSWTTSTPALQLVNSSGSPPPTALGALWLNGGALYAYGGSFSEDVTPWSGSPLWQCDLTSKAWLSVSATNNSVQRASEGAAAIVPGLGTNGASMAFYATGHLDAHTTPGWSDALPRLYLGSMFSLDLGTSPPTFHNYSSAISPRADGTLTYVPSSTGKGLLVYIGGSTDTTMTSMQELDVFDLDTSTWHTQPTNGESANSRVNHCAVRGSHTGNGVEQHQICASEERAETLTRAVIFGGQPIGSATQYSDLWILSIPNWTWTSIGGSLPNQPSGRAGHSCDLIGSQLVVIGGYVNDQSTCDPQLTYVLDTSSATWSTSYTAGTTYSAPPVVANASSSSLPQGPGSLPQGPASVPSAPSGNGLGSPIVTSTPTSSAGAGLQDGSMPRSRSILIAIFVASLAAAAGFGTALYLFARRRRRRHPYFDLPPSHARSLSDTSSVTSSTGLLNSFESSSSPPFFGFLKRPKKPTMSQIDRTPIVYSTPPFATPSSGETSGSSGWKQWDEPASPRAYQLGDDSDHFDEDIATFQMADGSVRSHLAPRRQLSVSNP